MQLGTIENLISYYLENNKFQEEVECAKKEFFDVAEDGIIISIDDKDKPYFMEWLVFDFRLKNGKSLVEDYYDRNPRKRPLYEMQVYKDLQNNVYGISEVQKVYPGEGLDLLMLHTGKKYFVHEHSATFQLKSSNLIFTRIAKIGDRYELVGADSIILDIRMNSQTKKSFIEKDKKITPRDAVTFFKSGPAKIPELSEEDDIAQIKMQLDELLNELGISEMVNSDLMQKWLANINFKRKGSALADILVGLTDKWPDEKQISRILDLSSKLANYSPQKSLKGKSPAELVQGKEFGSKGFDFSITRIGGEWPEFANKATSCLQARQIPEAMDNYEKAFRKLYKEKTTGRYIFSIFANFGVCHLYYGEEFMARKLLEAALELNGNYEFAKKMLSDMESETSKSHLADAIRFVLKFRQSKEYKEFKKKAKNLSDAELCKAYYDLILPDQLEEWEYSPAKKYFEFLKKLEINFSEA